MSVGALSVHKNYPVLLDAFDLYLAGRKTSKGKTEKLVIAGARVPGDEKIMERIQRHPHILYLSNLSSEDLFTLYRNALGTFCLSRIEGFGIPLLEAMSCGCPACYAGGSSMDEIGRDAAWKVPPNEPEPAAEVMKIFRAGGSELSKRTAEAMCISREYTWRRTAEQTCSVFLQTL